MKKNLLTLIILFAAGLLIGWLIGRQWPAAGRWSNLDKKYLPAASQGTVKADNLSGTVLEVKAQSVIFKTRVNLDDNLLVMQKEAKANNQTAIYLLTPKSSQDYFSDDYNKKLDALKESLTKAQAKNDTAGAKKIINQLKALTAEATAARSLEIQSLEQKLASLADGSAEKRDLAIKLEELNSGFKFSPLNLADIKTAATIQVWSSEDLSNADKFTASKIEVRQ